MTIKTNWEGSHAFIMLTGDIDETGAEEIKSAFRDVTSRSPQAVDLDFAGVTHIGSAGIGKLLVFYKDLGIRNAKLTLVRVPTAIHHLLCEMKLDTLFVVQQGR